MKSDVTDIEVQIHARTDRGIMVSTDGERDGAVWLPLSQCEVHICARGTATITLPEWLAIEKGLI